MVRLEGVFVIMIVIKGEGRSQEASKRCRIGKFQERAVKALSVDNGRGCEKDSVG